MNANETSPFRLEGSQIFSNSTDKLVATIENGEVVMMSGYNTMSKKVHEFFDQAKAAGYGSADNNAPLQEEEFLPEEEFARDHTAEVPVTDLPQGEANVFIGDAPKAGGTSAPAADLPQGDSDAKILIDSIPDDELPDLDPVHGTNTKSFRMFCKFYKLSGEQITALVRRLEAKLRG